MAKRTKADILVKPDMTITVTAGEKVLLQVNANRYRIEANELVYWFKQSSDKLELLHRVQVFLPRECSVTVDRGVTLDTGRNRFDGGRT